MLTYMKENVLPVLLLMLSFWQKIIFIVQMLEIPAQ